MLLDVALLANRCVSLPPPLRSPRTCLLTALPVMTRHMPMLRARLTWRVWLAVRPRVVVPYYGLVRIIMDVFMRPRFAPLVPSETRNMGMLPLPNLLISLIWCPPGALLVTAQHLMFRLVSSVLTSLRNEANRENMRIPPFLLTYAVMSLVTVLSPVEVPPVLVHMSSGL